MSPVSYFLKPSETNPAVGVQLDEGQLSLFGGYVINNRDVSYKSLGCDISGKKTTSLSDCNSLFSIRRERCHAKAFQKESTYLRHFSGRRWSPQWCT